MILATGATAAGAAMLAACGGAAEETNQSGLVSKAVDTSSKAVPGGIWQTQSNSDASSIDPITNDGTAAQTFITPLYSGLTKNGMRSDGRSPGNGDVKGDAAESWEFSPDGTQITLRMRPNHKFDPRPPTNGRAMTTADVKYSWDKVAATSVFGANLVYARNPSAPIDSASFPNERTVVFKLAFPYGNMPELLAYNSLVIAPVESEGAFNIKSEARGSGPFFLKEWKPSLSHEYTKNPDWYEKGRPFLDGYIRTVIKEYAAALAQFEAGNIWDFAVRQEDVIRVKNDHPRMVMTQNFVAGGASASQYKMSIRDDSPMKDVRVRQAASMAIDRELWIATLNNTENFISAGLPVETLWHSHLGAQGPSWMDPRSKEFGENGKYFQYNPTEAKKLLAAAGYKGQEVSFWFSDRGNVVNESEIYAGMLRDAGFVLDSKIVDYNTVWRQACQESGGTAYSGFCFDRAVAYNDEQILMSKYAPEGKFSVSNKEIPGITDRVRKVRTELDPERQLAQLQQLQRDLAPLMFDIPQAGITRGFALHWPWLKNFNVFTYGGTGDLFSSSRLYTEYWYDAAEKRA
jgi:peptide/nickel transport system substrate-binding protein